MDSKVFRPMTMIWPVVVCLNHLKSSGRCHGMREPAPITRLRDIAAMALKGLAGESELGEMGRMGRMGDMRSVSGVSGDVHPLELIFARVQTLQPAKFVHVGLHFGG